MDAAAIVLTVLVVASYARGRLPHADTRAVAQGVQVVTFPVLLGGVLPYALFYLLFAL
jgi:hypothetical protein